MPLSYYAWKCQTDLKCWKRTTWWIVWRLDSSKIKIYPIVIINEASTCGIDETARDGSQVIFREVWGNNRASVTCQMDRLFRWKSHKAQDDVSTHGNIRPTHVSRHLHLTMQTVCGNKNPKGVWLKFYDVPFSPIPVEYTVDKLKNQCLKIIFKVFEKYLNLFHVIFFRILCGIFCYLVKFFNYIVHC